MSLFSSKRYLHKKKFGMRPSVMRSCIHQPKEIKKIPNKKSILRKFLYLCLILVYLGEFDLAWISGTTPVWQKTPWAASSKHFEAYYFRKKT
jgi:hypothetical protein